jgi:hypothetical protein
METTYSNIISQLIEINKILKEETSFLTGAYNLLSEQYSYLIENSDETEYKSALNLLNSLSPKSKNQKDYDDTEEVTNLLLKDPSTIEQHLKAINTSIQSILNKNDHPLPNINNNAELSYQHELLYLISNAFKFKKLQMFIYKISVHHLPLNTFIPNDTHKALKENFDKTIRSYEKNKLILKYLRQINQHLCPLIQNSLKNFESFYTAYKHIPSNINHKNNNEDRFIYKNIYDSIIFNKDLWIRTLTEFDNENKMRYQIDMSKQQLNTFNEIKSIQIYLSNIHPDIDDTNKKRAQYLHNERYAKLQEQHKQITGARKRIEKLRQDIQSTITEHKQHDTTNNENISSTLHKMHSMLLMYALSVNETAYLKEQIWETLLKKYKPNTTTNTVITTNK